jgi:hypothetical protein
MSKQKGKDNWKKLGMDVIKSAIKVGRLQSCQYRMMYTHTCADSTELYLRARALRRAERKVRR